MPRLLSHLRLQLLFHTAEGGEVLLYAVCVPAATVDEDGNPLLAAETHGVDIRDAEEQGLQIGLCFPGQ